MSAPLSAMWVHGRLQGVQALTSLRHFGGGACAALPALPRPLHTLVRAAVAPESGCAHPPAAARRRRWRSQAAPQLQQAAGFSGSAAPPPAARAIAPGEVHIWWLDPTKVPLDSPELRRCGEMLTEEELRECEASEEREVWRERLLARAHVRSVLASYLAGSPDPRALLFERNPHGKPALLWPTATPAGHALRFNLTHTPSLIGLAVSVEGLVGLDVEAAERRTRGDPLRLARRRFSEQEVADMEALPEGAARASYFVQLWTLKEAYVKALGRGISAPPGLRSFSFSVGGGSPQAGGAAAAGSAGGSARGEQQSRCAGNGAVRGVVPGGEQQASGLSDAEISFQTGASDARRWQFALMQPAPGHMAALCAELSSSSSSASATSDASSDGSSSDGSGSIEERGLRLLTFETHPVALLGACGRPAEPLLLAQGLYCPA